MGRLIGIDLGTTYSAMACMGENGRASIIPKAEGQNITSSVLFFDGVRIPVGIDAQSAGEAAGFAVRALINEPMAAAIDFGIGQPQRQSAVSVYDLGGGTSDVTLMNVRNQETAFRESRFRGSVSKRETGAVGGSSAVAAKHGRE